jgi:nucleoside-diphosphate-sugar epimerase
MTFLPESDLQDVVSRVGPHWHELRGARVFLTGGTGFFGIWLTETFLRANEELGLGAELTVLTRDETAFLRKYPHLADVKGLRFHSGDIRDFSPPSGSFSHVIHAATPVTPLTSPKLAWETLDIILSGTRRLLDFAANSGCRRLLLTSSGAVYGVQPPNLHGFPETWSGAPETIGVAAAYGEGKRAAETMCARHAALYGYELRISRCFAFAGPGLELNGHLAIGNFVRDALAGIPPVVMGNPSTVRSYLYASDLAVGLWMQLLAGDAPPAMNLGSDRAISLGELAELIRRLLLPDSPAPMAGIDSPTSGPRYVPDITLSRQSLGLTPSVSLEDSILRMARHAGSLKK